MSHIGLEMACNEHFQALFVRRLVMRIMCHFQADVAHRHENAQSRPYSITFFIRIHAPHIVGYGRKTADQNTVKGRKQIEDIKMGFKEYNGFNHEHALMVVLDEEKLIALSDSNRETGKGVDWVTAFKDDPAAATKQFSDPSVLLHLILTCGAIIIDGAHRW